MLWDGEPPLNQDCLFHTSGLPEARIRAHPSHPSPGAEVELICEVSGGHG